MKVIAVRNGVKKEFTELAWKLLGKNTNGWKLVPKEAQKKKSGGEAKPEGGQKQDLNPTVPHSTDEGVNTDSAMQVIKEMKTIEEVKEYVKGEKRVTVIRASEKRMNELK